MGDVNEKGPPALPGEVWRGGVRGVGTCCIVRRDGRKFAYSWMPMRESWLLLLGGDESAVFAAAFEAVAMALAQREAQLAIAATNALRAVERAETDTRSGCADAVQALAENRRGDLGADWDGGWDAAIEEAVRVIRDAAINGEAS